MYLIALTGGIAAGKSTVASQLSDLGAVVIDADKLAREVVEPGQPALDEVIAAFGPDILHDDGSLNREALGVRIFMDPEARATLNSIMHPAIKRLSAQRVAEAEAANPNSVVVYDIPLLVETASDESLGRYDLIVVVHADRDLRLKRLVELRGFSAEEAQHRLNSQATDTERLAIADVVISANGTLEETRDQVDRLWKRIEVELRERVDGLEGSETTISGAP